MNVKIQLENVKPRKETQHKSFIKETESHIGEIDGCMNSTHTIPSFSTCTQETSNATAVITQSCSSGLKGSDLMGSRLDSFLFLENSEESYEDSGSSSTSSSTIRVS